jgi:hypothetical protein
LLPWLYVRVAQTLTISYTVSCVNPSVSPQSLPLRVFEWILLSLPRLQAPQEG